MNVYDTGYVNKNGGLTMNDSDIYIQDSQNDFVGMLRYTKSINSELGFSASSWSEIEFSNVKLALKTRNICPTKNYIAGITLGNPGLNYNNASVVTYVSGLTYSGSGSADTIGSLILTPLFQKLSKENPTKFTPDSASWYIFIYNNSMSNTTRRFNRQSYFNSSLTFSAQLRNLKVYRGSSFQTGVPYVYDGTNFNPAEAYYYNGSNFVKI